MTPAPSAAFALLALVVAYAVAERLPVRTTDRITALLGGRSLPLLLGIVTVLLLGWVGGGGLRMTAISTDENAYLLQARLLAHGRIAGPPAPIPEFFEQPWVMGFIFGSIPPATVETASKCPSGVAMVETSHSMLNLLVGSFTGGILTPMTIKVTCATSGRSEGPTIRSAGNPMKAISEAVEQSRASGGPVFVQF